MLSLLVAASVSVSGCGYDGPSHVTGLAVEPDSQQLIYCEYFLPTEDNRTRVLYYTPSGHRFAEKDLFGAASEDGAATSLPEVVQQDYRNGERREVRKGEDSWLLRYRKSATASWKEARVPINGIDVIDAGFDDYVRKHWDELVAGRQARFDFASPPHGRGIELRARRVDCHSGDQRSLCLRVDLAQPLLRFFAGDLDLVYDRATRRLQQFEGIVNVLDDRSSAQRLQIHYHYD
ncbi:hypothetical protein [Microbulbifer hainanensis]|uniref:hypothetical protein n=1 Tax=Microbulbifer hainanensis TaxID=2735675 RepID=UPI0018681866|nr:hypothetical protein [Microbulbifer hainanensis]